MRVTVRLYAALRRYLPKGADGDTFELELPPGATVAELLDKVGIPVDHAKMCVVDGEQCGKDRTLHEGAVVGVFPPLAGGVVVGDHT